jgi:hypothetical protein
MRIIGYRLSGYNKFNFKISFIVFVRGSSSHHRLLGEKWSYRGSRMPSSCLQGPHSSRHRECHPSWNGQKSSSSICRQSWRWWVLFSQFAIASINVLAFKSIQSAKAILTDATLIRGLALRSRQYDETAVTPSYSCSFLLNHNHLILTYSILNFCRSSNQCWILGYWQSCCSYSSCPWRWYSPFRSGCFR